MCNCSKSPASICTQCQQGNTCGCPPDYSVMPQPVACGCCPDGFIYKGITPNFPNGYCVDAGTQTKAVPSIACNTCEESMSADCIYLPAIPCLGIAAGTTLSAFLLGMCANPTTVVQFLLSSIGLNPALGSGFCQLVQNCPASSASSTPIIGTIIVTFP